MNIWKRALTLLLAASMLLTAGCSSEDTSWAYRTQDTQLPIGVYIFYMIDTVNEAASKVQEQHEGDEDYVLPEKYKDLLAETIDGAPVADFIQAEAERKIRQHIAVERKFDDMELTLTDSQQQYAINSAANSYSEFYEENGVAESSVALVFENSIKEQVIYLTIYGEEGELAVPRNVLETTLSENYVAADVMVFTKDFDDDGEVTNAELAESYLKRATDGEDLYDLIFEQEKKDAMEAAAEGEDVELDQPEPDSRLAIFSEADRATYGDALIDAVFASKIGEPAKAEDDYYHYLFLRRDILEDPDYVDMYFDELLDILKADEFSDLLDQWAGDITMERNDAALGKYTPSKLSI